MGSRVRFCIQYDHDLKAGVDEPTRQKTPYLLEPCLIEYDADYVLMFPIRLPPESTCPDLIDWKALKDSPLESARKIFKPRCARASDIFVGGMR